MIQKECILITGGCGAIGSEVTNRLKQLQPDKHFVVYDNLTYAGDTANIEPPYENYTFVKGDICNVKQVTDVLEKYRPDVIMHLAAETHVDNSFGNSFQFTHTNVFGTHVLLECSKKYMETGNNLRLFLHMSTDEVYGSVSDDEPPCVEQSLFHPSNPYAASKAAAEMICQAYLRSFKIPLIVARCNNAISKYQNEEKLIPKVVSSIINGTKIPIHGKGESKRTFIHSYDIADALATIVDHGSIGESYNIGSNLEYTVMNVVSYILGKMKPEEDIGSWINYVPDRAFQDYRYSIDSSALQSLGWSQRIGFEDAVDDVINHHLAKGNRA